ncbi:MAG: FtsB family cell division protein [Longimicrobiales bacterium]
MKLRWVLATLFVLGAVYFALFGGDYSFFEVRRLERDRAAEHARLEALQNELGQLRARTDSLQKDPATLERVAREKYGMIRDGERLYRFVDSAQDSTTRSRSVPGRR